MLILRNEDRNFCLQDLCFTFLSNTVVKTGVVEWLTRRTSNLHGFKPSQGQAVVSLSKKLHTNYSVLVGSRSVSIKVLKVNK